MNVYVIHPHANSSTLSESSLCIHVFRMYNSVASMGVYQRWVVVRVFHFVWFRDVIHVAISIPSRICVSLHVYIYMRFIMCVCISEPYLVPLSTNRRVVVRRVCVLSGFRDAYSCSNCVRITQIRFYLRLYMRFSMCVCIIEPYGVVYQRWVIDVVLY